MMKLFLHREKESGTLVFLREESETYRCSRRKYVGRKAKIEAIKRFSKGEVRLSPTMSTGYVNQYIKDNIFGTSSWAKYHEIFLSVAGERECIERPVSFMATVLVDNRSNLEEKDVWKAALEYIREKELYNNSLIEIVL